MLQLSSAQDVLSWFNSSAALQADGPRTLLLAAHPDDETIGASAVLSRLRDVLVAYLTDGAPVDAQFRSAHITGSRDSYACVRAEEAARALAVSGVDAQQITFLGGIDQDAISQVPFLLGRFLNLIKSFQPTVVITHPYEGGHPDHDTAALVAQLAIRIASVESLAAPVRLEMTSYHASNGTRVTGEFLSMSEGSGDVITLRFSPQDRERKTRMLESYVSQRDVLSAFPHEPERLRVAPLYDFTQAPHGGQLWYESLNWPTTGRAWRETARTLLRQLGHGPCH